MTAEVAILNRNAVALAADSAVTLGNGKVFNSVNKLFSLSKYHPVGIMIYGDASFCAVPWETVIKMYRQGLGRKRKDTLQEYAEDFLKYLGRETLFHNPITLDAYFDEIIHPAINYARTEHEKRIADKTLTGQQILDEAAIVFRKQEQWMKSWPVRHKDPTRYGSTILRKYSDRIDDIIKGVFGKVPLQPKHAQLLRRIAVLAIVRDQPFNLRAGLVIAGFGEREIFPSYLHYSIGGVFGGRLKYLTKAVRGLHPNMPEGVIAPFAQSESAWAFMGGIDPDFSDGIRGFVNGLLSTVDAELKQIGDQFAEKLSESEFDQIRKLLRDKHHSIVEGFDKQIDQWRQDKHINPLMSIVASLPKDEMGALAESLVSLTSYKRRFSPDSETVGGPIDVAVISKGDGFVWMKRKHYFEPTLNPQFFTRYYYEHEEKTTVSSQG